MVLLFPIVIRLMGTTLSQNVSFLSTIAMVTTRMQCSLLYVLHVIISSLCAEAVARYHGSDTLM